MKKLPTAGKMLIAYNFSNELDSKMICSFPLMLADSRSYQRLILPGKFSCICSSQAVKRSITKNIHGFKKENKKLFLYSCTSFLCLQVFTHPLLGTHRTTLQISQCTVCYLIFLSLYSKATRVAWRP